MSATGRIKVLSEALPPPAGCAYPEGTTLRAVTRTKRKKNDFYETPAWAVDAIIPHLPFDRASLIVDAGAGTGAIASRVVHHFPHLEVIGVEKQHELVQEGRARGMYGVEFVEADYEKWQSERASPDIVIMNPPYSRAIEFIRRALSTVRRDGVVAALLRVGFTGGALRAEFHAKHPSKLRVLDRRPSFTGGGTDASEYGWFVWSPGEVGTWEPLHIPRLRTKRLRK